MNPLHATDEELDDLYNRRKLADISLYGSNLFSIFIYHYTNDEQNDDPQEEKWKVWMYIRTPLPTSPM